MQINISPNAAAGVNTGGQVNADFALPELAAKESITAKVIFSAGDTVHLKTADGAVIRARLEGGLSLPEGSEVKLTVADKSANTITLRLLSGTQTASGVAIFLSAAAPAARQPALPPALLDVFMHLQTADLPVAQKLGAFANALANFPGLTAQDPAVAEALAHLAAPPAAAPAGVPAQTLPAVGQLLAELATLLNTVEQAAPQTGQPVAPQTPAMPGMPAEQPAAPQTPAMPVAGTPTQAATATVEQAAPQNGQPVAPQTPVIPGDAAVPQGIEAPLLKGGESVLNTAQPVATPVQAPVQAPMQTPTQTPAQTPLSPAQQQEARQFAQQVVAELFPKGQPALQPRQVAQFVSRLFARLGESAAQGAEALHKSARELEARLTILKEAIENSSLPRREELLSQTSRIIQQTESLRDSRLLCLQIPIQFEQNRQTAELYVFRRERHGGSKLDPQNATILLALNTEHLGRLEALIQTRGKEINLKLDIARAEAVPFVREHSAALRQLLAEGGFKLNSAAVGQLSRKTDTPQAAQRALTEFQRSFDGRLDFFI